MSANITEFNLKEILKKHSDNLAFDNLTYHQWINQIQNIHSWLKNLKIQSDDYVAIQMENSPQIPSLIFALWELRAIPILLNPDTPNSDYENIIKNIPDLNQNNHECALRFPLEQTGLVIFTSGTTSKAKGVVLTIGNLLYSALGSNEYFKLRPHHRWKISLPMSRIGGIVISFRTMLAGATSCFEGNATHYSLVPAQVKSMTEELKKADVVLVGGGPITTECRQLCQQESIPLYTSYGMSEMASTIAIEHNNQTIILPYRDLKIDKQKRIAVRGKCCFKEYLDGAKPFDHQNYFYTGDLGEIDTCGLKIIGRNDQVFISGGINIDPYLIETLLKNIDEIKEAIVVPAKDSKWGQVPIAFIKSNQTLTTDQLKKKLKSQIHPHHHPKAYHSYQNETRQELIRRANKLWNK